MTDSVTRLARSWTTVPIALGDATIISLQLAYGLSVHGVDPAARPAYAAETVAPFLLGWFVAAPMLGAYAAGVHESLARTALAVTISWTVAAVIGVGLRATPYFPGDAPAAFLVVTVAIGLATLLPWRLAIALLSRRIGASRGATARSR